MGHPKRAITTEEAMEIIKQGKGGTLCTAGVDGVPYGVPVNYYYDDEENAVVFHCALKGRKLKNIRENSRVSFVVVGEEHIVEERYITHYESAMIEGCAEIITEAEEKERLIRRLCDRLTPHEHLRRDEVVAKYLPAVCMVKVRVERISGKRNRDE